MKFEKKSIFLQNFIKWGLKAY